MTPLQAFAAGLGIGSTLMILLMGLLVAASRTSVAPPPRGQERSR